MRMWKWTSLALVLSLTASASAIDPKYLPPNAESAVTINLKALMASEMLKSKKDMVDQFKAMVKGKLEESPAKEFLDKAGFDLFRDLHTITFTSDGSKDVDAMFMAIEGKFDADKLVDVAKEASAAAGDAIRVTRIGNVNVFEITPKADEKTIYAGLVNDNLLVAAPTKEALNAMIARVNGGRAAGVKAGLKNLLQTTNNKQTLSIVATGAAIAKGMENAPRQPEGEIGAMLQSVEGLAVSVTVAKDLNFQVAVDAKDEESAKKMAAGANFGLLAMRGMVARKAKEEERFQPVADIANTLRVTNQGANVLLRGEVSLENLDRLLALLPNRQ